MDTSSLNLSPETLEEFCTRHQIVELALFGSAVRGELEPESDIDFLVTYAPERKFRPWGYIPEVDEMETLLGRKVDWLFRSAVEYSRNPIFRKDVLSTAKVIYEKR